MWSWVPPPSVKVASNGFSTSSAALCRRRARLVAARRAQARAPLLLAGAWVGVGERLAQRADLDAKGCRLNADFAPDAGEQFGGAHHIAVTVQQAQEDVHRPTAEDHGDTLMKQQPFDGPKLERTEQEAIAWSVLASRAHTMRFHLSCSIRVLASMRSRLQKPSAYRP